jgi:hypothetical protein
MYIIACLFFLLAAFFDAVLTKLNNRETHSKQWYTFTILSVTCLALSIVTYRTQFGLFQDIAILYGVRFATLWLAPTYLFPWGIQCAFIKNLFHHTIIIEMQKVKKLQIIESRFVAKDANGNFMITAGVQPITVDLVPDSATWAEQAMSSAGGIYAYQNVLEFRLSNLSLTRRACRSRISVLITLENDAVVFVNELRVSASIINRISNVKVITYRYRTDSFTKTPQVDVSTTSTSGGTGQIIIRPKATSYYNALSGIIGVNLLGR